MQHFQDRHGLVCFKRLDLVKGFTFPMRWDDVCECVSGDQKVLAGFLQKEWTRTDFEMP